jgi:electron transfer flavoprotein alpha subunit
MTPPTDLLLIAETIDNQLQHTLQDLLGAARSYTAAAGGTARLLLPGVDVAAMAADLADTTGLDVFTLENPGLNLPNSELTAALVNQALPQIRPRYICLPHTVRGCHTAAALSVQVSKPAVTGVESIDRMSSTLLFRRALFNGKLTATLAVPEAGAVFTVLGGDAPDAASPPHGAGTVTPLPAMKVGSRAEPLSLSKAQDDEAALEEADAIVSAGRGVGKEENLTLLRDVARILKNCAMGGSRTACDAGWLPYARQIGETGRHVAPKLYLACGISGARQHLAGIKNARLVVAVNTDPQAAIFGRADYGIVEDVTRFLPVLLKKYGEIFEQSE